MKCQVSASVDESAFSSETTMTLIGCVIFQRFVYRILFGNSFARLDFVFKEATEINSGRDEGDSGDTPVHIKAKVHQHNSDSR